MPATDAPLTAADLFGLDGAAVKARTRYSLEGSVIGTPAGGKVGAGRMAGKPESAPLLVHTDIPSRGEQSIDLIAVSTAIVGGVIPYPVLVKAFAREGKLDELKQAVAAHKAT